MEPVGEVSIAFIADNGEKNLFKDDPVYFGATRLDTSLQCVSSMRFIFYVPGVSFSS